MTAMKEWDKLDEAEVLGLVKSRLSSLGYDAEDKDFSYEIERESEEIKNVIHQAFVPEGLKYVLVDRVCGSVLDAAYNAGVADFVAPASSVNIGDTSVSFGPSGTPSMASIISDLKKSGEKELLRYRKLCF